MSVASRTMPSFVEMCSAYQPGVLDELDKETQHIMSDIRSSLMDPITVSAEEDGMRFMATVTPSGPGPPFSGPLGRRQVVALDTVINTVNNREAFSEKYIKHLDQLRAGTRAYESKGSKSTEQIPRNITSLRGARKSLHQRRQTGLDVFSSSKDAMSDPSSPLTAFCADGTLVVRSVDTSYAKKANTLSPVTDGETYLEDYNKAKGTQQGTLGSAQKGVAFLTESDGDFVDRNNWQARSNDKVPNAKEAGSATSYYIHGTLPNQKDMSRYYWKSGSPNDPKVSGGVPSKALPRTFTKGRASSDQRISRPAFPSWNSLPEMGSTLNTNVFMPMAPAGQEKLKKHVNKRQIQRASDQDAFISQSVTGRTVSTRATYTVSYGDLQVPTTDVEMFAILSVEKHNLPVQQESSKKRRQRKKDVPIAEKIAEKIDRLTHIDGKSGPGHSLCSRVPAKNDTSFVETTTRPGGLHVEETWPIEVLTRDLSHKSVSPTKRSLPGTIHERLGQVVFSTEQPQRYYDKKSQCLRRSRPQPLLLKPLISTLTATDNKCAQEKVATVQEQDLSRSSQPLTTELKPVTADNEKSGKTIRRNIMVHIPAATDDVEDDLLSETSQNCSKGESECRLGRGVRQPYTPHMVQLGDRESLAPSVSSASSASSGGAPPRDHCIELISVSDIANHNSLSDREELSLSVLGSGVKDRVDSEGKCSQRLVHSADEPRDQTSDSASLGSPVSFKPAQTASPAPSKPKGLVQKQYPTLVSGRSEPSTSTTSDSTGPHSTERSIVSKRHMKKPA